MQLGQRCLVVGDGLFQLGDAAGDMAPRLGLEVVVFQTEELVAQPPTQFSDGLLDLAEALACRAAGSACFGRFQHLLPVGVPIGTIDRAGEDPRVAWSRNRSLRLMVTGWPGGILAARCMVMWQR